MSGLYLSTSPWQVTRSFKKDHSTWQKNLELKPQIKKEEQRGEEGRLGSGIPLLGLKNTLSLRSKRVFYFYKGGPYTICLTYQQYSGWDNDGMQVTKGVPIK